MNIQKILLMILAALVVALPQAYAETLVTYYHNDHLGSPIAATDQNGNLLWRETYSPYGQKLVKVEANTNQPIGYTGKPDDALTGLTYMNARYYDPVVGRFMAMDPVGVFEAGEKHFSTYVYVYNNPFNYTDPSGMIGMCNCGTAGAGGVDSSLDPEKAAAERGEIDDHSYGKGFRVDGRNPMWDEPIHPIMDDFLVEILPPLKFGKLGAVFAAFLGGAKYKVVKEVKDLKPTLIQENPRNLIPTQTKAEMSGSQVKRLTKNMKESGYDQSKPVDVWRNPVTGRLEIQDGHHRVEAAKKAGLDKIPVQVWE